MISLSDSGRITKDLFRDNKVSLSIKRISSLQQNMECHALGMFLCKKNPGSLVRDTGLMKKEDYCEILDINMWVDVRNLKLKCGWSFMYVIDSKHT